METEDLRKERGNVAHSMFCHSAYNHERDEENYSIPLLLATSKGEVQIVQEP